MDIDLVAEIIQDQFPHLFPARVDYLGEGYDSIAFDVNGEWVFRFPQRADVERQLLLELQILPSLSKRTPVPIPAYCFHGKPSSGFPRHFAGYPKIPGVPGIQLDPALVPFHLLAPTMARFLSSLHSFPVSEADRLGVERCEINALIEEVRAEALADFEIVNGVLPEARLEAWYAYLKAGPGVGTQPPSAPVLVHSDLAAEHILIDPIERTVTGVIDWSDIAVGDRAVDFAGAFHWSGETFLEAILSAYDGPIDDRVRPLARYLAACRGVADVVFGVERNRGEYVAAGIRALTWQA